MTAPGPGPARPAHRRAAARRDHPQRRGRIWQGQLDSPLSELGLAQADAVGAAVAALSPDRIVSSDLTRARLTAESVGRACGIPVELDPRFREIDAGVLAGPRPPPRSRDGGRRSRPPWCAARTSAAAGRRSGETMADVLERVGEALDELLGALPGQCLVVSTHGGAAKAVLAWLLGLDLAVAWRVLGPPGQLPLGEAPRGALGWRLQTWNAASGMAPRARVPRRPEADLGRCWAMGRLTVAPSGATHSGL